MKKISLIFSPITWVVIKKSTVATLCIALTGLLLTLSCDNPEYPIEIPFTEYSLNDTSCQWENLNYDDSVIIINSNEELQNYITCSNYSEIDFSKYTLLLAYGVEGHPIYPNEIRLQQLCNQNYIMTVNLHPGVVCVISYWQTPIIVSKIPDNSNITLIVTKNF